MEIKDGRWKMEDGRRKTEDGRQKKKTEDGRPKTEVKNLFLLSPVSGLLTN